MLARVVSHPTTRPPRAHDALLAALTGIALAALLARRADGAPVLPLWLEIALQLPAALAWCHIRCHWFGLTGARGAPAADLTDLWLTIVAGAGAAGLALGLRQAEAFFAGTTALLSGLLLIEALGRRYRRLDTLITDPIGLARTFLGPWLLLIVLATLFLSLPVASHAAIPDYRHNFWDHVLNNAFAAVGSACLVGTTIYNLGAEYSRFGQAVLVVTMQLAGMGFAALGLAVIRPFLVNTIRLRTVLRFSTILQLLAIVAMWPAWTPAEAPSIWDRFWWGVVHAGSACWNGGLMMRGDGLAGHVWHPAIFASITTLSVIGSLGLPIILDLTHGLRSDRKPNTTRSALPAAPWQALPQWEAGLAFVLLMSTAVALWFLETPWRPRIVWRLPESWIPVHPFDLGTTQLALRDEMPLPRRWTLAVFVSATLRSAGMQSIPVMEGTLSWPSYGLLLGGMFIGGSAAGVAGGARTTALLLPVLCLLRRRSSWSRCPGGEEGRRLLLRAALRFIPLWLGMNLVSSGLLSLVSDGSPYEHTFENVAACNSVGLTTGLSLHLTWAGRLAMISIMIVGRVAPVAYWLHTTRGFTECLRRTRG